MKNKRLGIYLFLAVLLGIISSTLWFQLYNPMKPLYVEIVNETEKLIPSVIVEHGNATLQEQIMLVRLKPKEKRTIVLNHKPGLGFNIKANFENGEKAEICAGKSKDHWFFRETITKFGIYTTPIR